MTDQTEREKFIAFVVSKGLSRDTAEKHWDHDSTAAEAWKARAALDEGQGDDWRRLAVVAIGFLGLTSKRLGEGWQAHSTISAIEEFLKAHGNVAALRTTKPADDERLALIRWIIKTYGITSNGFQFFQSGAVIPTSGELLAAFNEQQKGERRDV